MALRNSHWNFRKVTAPKQGEYKDVKIIKNTTGHGGLTVCNKTIHGKQFATYRVKGRKYFRYSFTKKKWFGWHNMQLGWLPGRIVFKNRVW